MSAIRALRAVPPDALARAARRRLSSERPPVIVDVIADAYVARLREAERDEGREQFVRWLRGVCSSYGDVAQLHEVLVQLPLLLATALREDFDVTVSSVEFERLALELDAIVREHWRPIRLQVQEPIDEIDACIDTFVRSLEARDPLTSEHSRAVASWCARLARRLWFDDDEVKFASRCGLLHDIGKVRVPLEILGAPRKLDDREWRVMRAHAAAGEAIIRRDPRLRVFVPAVRSHHERLDGRGYPDGLRASAIPQIARLVAVADCFNAMIGRRPYRLPLAPSRAMDELDANRHTQFDPEVVDAMIALFEVRS
jgi:putative nucleotidyltransferase with HDIG domain